MTLEVVGSYKIKNRGPVASVLEGGKKMSSIKDGSYINIQSFMVTELELKGNELLVYAIIYGFSQTNGTYFTGSTQYLAEWTNSTKQGIFKNLKSLIEKGLIEKVGKNQQVNYYKALRPVNKVNQSTKFNTTGKQSLMEGSTKFTGTSKQSLPNNIYNNINNNILNNIECSSNIDNLDNNNSSTENNITTTTQKFKSLEDENLKITDFYQEKLELDEKAVDFRTDVLELRELIATATGESIVTVDMVFKPYLYTGIIKKVLEKIKASKFLSGKKERKPSLHIFVRKDKINEILAGLYDDFEEKPKTRPVQQESYIAKKLRELREQGENNVEEVEYAR